MRVVFQSPVTEIWYCLYTEHIECVGNQVFVRDGETMVLAYEGKDAVSKFEHLIEYGRIRNAYK